MYIYIYKFMYTFISHISAALIQGGPPGYFMHASITTPVASRLKKLFYPGLSRSPNGHFINNFWIQVAVTEVKRPLRNCFGSETVTNLYL
jgi:hypothetical protein